MISQAMLNKLREFGLNSYEAKTWAAILLKGTATASTLSELANVPRSRCYDVLESLEKKGFIIAKVGRPMKYMAVTPEEAVERVKSTIRKTTEEQINSLDTLKSSTLMEELNKLHLSGMESVTPEELTGIIKQKKNVDSHFSSMIRGAKKEVLIAADTQDLVKKIAILQTLLPSLSKKPTVRILTEENAETKRLAKTLRNIAEVKTAPNISRFFITDNAATLFISGADGESAIWVNAPDFVEGLRDVFETKWANS